VVDFSRLVLRPCIGAFPKAVSVNPLKSQPGHPAYDKQADGVAPLRGIWTVRNIDVQTEDGAIMSSVTYTLGIRLSEFTVPPVPEDQVTVDGVAYLIDDSDPDGQGGAVLTLKSTADPRFS
jgi:hypothetical protein